MRKTLACAAVAAFTCALAWGQGAAVVLDNQESAPFYYVIDPPELAGLTAGSPLLASRVAGYFSAADSTVDFANLAPLAQGRNTDLRDGSHLLVGFFAIPDAEEFPVRVMAIQADSAGERFYAIFASPAQLSVRPGIGRLASFGRPAPGTTASTGTAVATAASPAAAADQGAAGAQPAGSSETTALPTLATFSGGYDPVVFTREKSGSFTVLPIAQSRSWAQTGTRISSVQGAFDSTGFHLALNVAGGFSHAVSYFLYVFDSRAEGTDNQVTLEVQPLARGSRGACILWRKGAAPQLLGTVTAAATSARLDVTPTELSAVGLSAPVATATVDLTAGWYDRALGMWEEFYYSTIPVTR